MKNIDHALFKFETLQPCQVISNLSSTVAVLLLLVTLAGCSSAVIRLNQQAHSFGFAAITSNADGFVITSYYQPEVDSPQRLHVYLEGDGSPWENGWVPAAEPTTRASVMLPLMAMDPSSSLYLGRPCYNGHAGDAGCSAKLWTDARYSEQVVAAMTKVLMDFSAKRNYRELVLIGHSGGGTLALLLAERLPQTAAVVTLAGNYDIDLWADYHGYPRLSKSLNPATRQATATPQWHLLGNRDRQIPPQLFQESLQRRSNSRVDIVDADHSQGWQAIWPRLLQSLSQYY